MAWGALVLALAAAPAADVARCKQAVEKVASYDDHNARLAAFQSCGPLLSDRSLRTAWLQTVHSAPFDAAVVMATAAGTPPGPNACAQTKSVDLAICAGDRIGAERVPNAQKAVQWKTLFLRVLDAELSAADAAALKKVFAVKWAVMFPAP